MAAYHFMSLNAYSKHKKLCNDYIRYYSGGKSLDEVCFFVSLLLCFSSNLAILISALVSICIQLLRFSNETRNCQICFSRRE